MVKRTRLFALATLAAFALAAGSSPVGAQPKPVETVGATWMITPGPVLDAFAQYNAEMAWYFGVEAQRQADAAAAAAARPARGGGGPVGGTVGECTGFAIPDYIIQRESGGNPSAYNPSGAYGCAQTLLSHYSGGSCSGLDPYTIDGQRECVNRLSNGGTNLAPWSTR